MGVIEDEYMSCVGDLVDPSVKVNNIKTPKNPETPIHFSEYHTQNRLSEDSIKSFNKLISGPTDEEREAYAIKRAKEEEELRKWREEEARRGPAFLSDEWRCARIDAQVDACRRYIDKYG